MFVGKEATMTTGRDIVTGALKLLGVLEAGATPSATDAEESLDELNKMALAWDAMGVHTGWTTIGLDDAFPLEDRHRSGVEALLAQHLQGSYGSALTDWATRRALQGWQLLMADYHRPETLRVDIGLQGFPSGRWGWFF
jgi:hypothetical protein